MPKKCGLSINLYVCVQGRIREWLTLTYTLFHSLIKFCMFLSLNIIDYLIGLAFFGPFQLSFSMWLGVEPK